MVNNTPFLVFSSSIPLRAPTKNAKKTLANKLSIQYQASKRGLAGQLYRKRYYMSINNTVSKT
ncbi:hypothetical protein NEOC65_000345 [Neochlamydia sp. AcF65]|nr:hypothetical protein [Neochlamydia sp. AcF65]